MSVRLWCYIVCVGIVFYYVRVASFVSNVAFVVDAAHIYFDTSIHGVCMFGILMTSYQLFTTIYKVFSMTKVVHMHLHCVRVSQCDKYLIRMWCLRFWNEGMGL
jgi:hypothetical protein